MMEDMFDFSGTPFDLGAWLRRQGLDGPGSLRECSSAPWPSTFLLSETQVASLMELDFPRLDPGYQVVAHRIDRRGVWSVRVMHAEHGSISSFTGAAWLMGPDGRFVVTHCMGDDATVDERLGPRR